MKCKHFIGVDLWDGTVGTDPSDYEQKYLCKAFPDGIPEAIQVWANPHCRVCDDQKGEFIFEHKQAYIDRDLERDRQGHI